MGIGTLRRYHPYTTAPKEAVAEKEAKASKYTEAVASARAAINRASDEAAAAVAAELDAAVSVVVSEDVKPKEEAAVTKVKNK